LLRQQRFISTFNYLSKMVEGKKGFEDLMANEEDQETTERSNIVAGGDNETVSGEGDGQQKLSVEQEGDHQESIEGVSGMMEDDRKQEDTTEVEGTTQVEDAAEQGDVTEQGISREQEDAGEEKEGVGAKEVVDASLENNEIAEGSYNDDAESQRQDVKINESDSGITQQDHSSQSNIPDLGFAEEYAAIDQTQTDNEGISSLVDGNDTFADVGTPIFDEADDEFLLKSGVNTPVKRSGADFEKEDRKRAKAE
jgi:hypothetical protein